MSTRDITYISELDVEIFSLQTRLEMYASSAIELEAMINDKTATKSNKLAYEKCIRQMDSLGVLLEKKSQQRDELVEDMTADEIHKLAEHIALGKMKQDRDSFKYLSHTEEKELLDRTSQYTKDLEMEQINRLGRKYNFIPSSKNTPIATEKEILLLIKAGELRLQGMTTKAFKEKTEPLLRSLNWTLMDVQELVALHQAEADRVAQRLEEVQKFNGMANEVSRFMKAYHDKKGGRLPARFYAEGEKIQDNPDFEKLHALVNRAYQFVDNKLKAISMYQESSNHAPTEEIKQEMQDASIKWQKNKEQLEKLHQEMESNQKTTFKLPMLMREEKTI